MSKANPRKALAALLPAPVAAGGFTVRPMTLAMWAALERIDSPLLRTEGECDALALIPSLYLLTHGAQEFFKQDFTAAAFAWADGVPASAVLDIRRAAQAQLKAVQDVIPEDDPERPRKKATGRSPSSQAGRPATPAGAGTTSSTRCRSHPSASSDARNGSMRGQSSRSK